MAVSYIPEGQHTVTAHLVIRGAAAAIEFYKKAFGATEVMRMVGPDGASIAHAEIKIGDSHVFLAEEWPGAGTASPAKLGGTTVTLMLYVKDCDASFQQAVSAGAKAIMPPTDMFWGDRYGRLTDPFGHEWAIATHKEDVSPAEMAKRAEEAFKQMGGQG